MPGYTNPVPIGSGSLNFKSTPATQVRCYEECDAIYENPGGNASVTGSVFRLPSGSLLLSGSFLSASSSLYESGGSQVRFSGQLTIFVNPALMANLGMAGLPNSGPALLSDWFQTDGVQNYFVVSITFTSPNTRTLHSFTGGADGGLPPAGLTMDEAGNLYGVAYSGGVTGFGTVFQMKRAGSGWIFNTLYGFKGGATGPILSQE